MNVLLLIKDKKKSGKLIIIEQPAFVPLSGKETNFLIEDIGLINEYKTKF